MCIANTQRKVIVLKTNSEEEVSVVTSITRNTITVNIHNRNLQVLVDSGASVSCLSKITFDKFCKTNQLKPKISKLSNVVGVGGERHSVFGEVDCPVNIDGLIVHQKFVIVENLHHEVILGLNFMVQNHVKIDFHNRLLSVGEDAVTVSLLCDSRFGYARPSKRVTVASNSEVIVPVRVSGVNKNDTILLEPATNLHEIMLASARTLVKTKNRGANLRIINPTDKAISISPRVVLATVSPIDSAEIYPLCSNKQSKIVSNINTDSCTESTTKDLKFEIDNAKLSNTEKQDLNKFLVKNSDIFSTSLVDIGKTDIFSHKIGTLPGAPPVHLAPHRVDPIKKKEIERQTAEMEDAGLIRQSNSVWHSPVVLVKKKDNSWRFAIDYRKLNSITVPISHPLPRIEDVFDALGESKATIFSTLDLNSAYYQVALDPETRHKASFVTHEGVYEFLRMPFGLRNAPMSFQLLMSMVLRGLNWKYVLCYIDDILVFSPNLETHITHLDEVFQRLRDAKLTLKPSKCKFGVDKIMFLGHILSENGVQVDPSKTEKVQNFPIPKTQKELRGFLGYVITIGDLF